jgi:hypothetical protein
MTYRGHIENGVVVLDESAELPEGVGVEINILAGDGASQGDADNAHARLMRFAGIIKDMPEDASLNVDHYLYGHPKR